MKNLNDTLPELMRRATENLEPESTDLVERGMARGLTLRRRRTALFTVTGATAVLATAGVIVGGSQLFAKDAPPPAASTTTKQSTSNVVAKPVTPKETVATLIKLLPQGFKVSKTQSWDDGGGYQAELLINDGKGLSLLGVAVRPAGMTDGKCDGGRYGATCEPRADGSILTAMKDQPEYGPDNNPGGIVYNHVFVVRKGTESISLINYNGTAEKQTVKTRPKPALTVAQLTAIADSNLWRFPPKPKPQPSGPDKPNPTSPGASKPPVPVQQTLQTLRAVLPNGLQVTQPQTRGGTPHDYNAASVLVDDGKGKSYVEAFVTYQVPTVKKCGVEGAPNHCRVLPGGGVAGWDKNSPEYSDARQDKEGVLANTAVIHYADGRYISITSYNAVEEKGSKHTRPKPAISVEKLLEMAGNKAWKFPGTKQ
jgi:hypothetical protein